MAKAKWKDLIGRERWYNGIWARGYLGLVDGDRAKGMNYGNTTRLRLSRSNALLTQACLASTIYTKKMTVSYSQMYKSGMLIEEQGNKRIYRCSEYSDEEI